MKHGRTLAVRGMMWGIITVIILGVLCPLPVAAIPWPGETWSASTDLTSLNPTGWATNLSGAYWNPDTRRLWVCTNGPAVFWSLMEDGLGGFIIEQQYTGTGDLEGITQTPSDPDLVFVIDEQARILRSYSVSTGAASTTWSLTSIPDWGNSGPEGIAFVPDAWLAQSGFVDGSGIAYPQSVHVADGYGGLLFVAVQNNGWVFVFDLKNDGTFIFVGQYLTSRTESCEMTFDGSTGRMYILHNIDGNLIEVTDMTSSLSGVDRQFNTYVEVQVPSGSNIEGFALTPALTTTATVGDNWCFFTDDNCADGALRWFQGLASTLQKLAGDGQTAEINTTVSVAPAVLASDAFTNPLPGFSIDYAVASGGGVVTGENAVTDADGIAAVGSWQLGATPGTNSLTATGFGLTGSPQTFTATAVDTPPIVTINQQSAQADPINTLPIVFDVEFSEDVTGFDDTDITQSGTAAGVTFSVSAVDASHYTVSATAVSVDGTVQPTIAAGVCTDLTANDNVASTSTDNTVTLDRDAPTIAIGLPNPTETGQGPVTYELTYSEPCIISLTADDIELSFTDTATGEIVVSGSGDTTRTVTIQNIAGSGTLWITVVPLVDTDLAGNYVSAAGPSQPVIVTEAPAAPVSSVVGLGVLASLFVAIKVRRSRYSNH